MSFDIYIEEKKNYENVFWKKQYIFLLVEVIKVLYPVSSGRSDKDPISGTIEFLENKSSTLLYTSFSYFSYYIIN